MILSPEAVSGSTYENVFQRRLAYQNRLDLTGKCFYQVGDKAVAVFPFDAYFAAHHRCVHMESHSNSIRERLRFIRFAVTHSVSSYPI